MRLLPLKSDPDCTYRVQNGSLNHSRESGEPSGGHPERGETIENTERGKETCPVPLFQGKGVKMKHL